MYKIAAAITLLLFATLTPVPLEAKPHADTALCKKIQKAVRAGRTLDQITFEFQVDTPQVMTCLQTKSKGHKQKPPKNAKAKHASAAGTAKVRTAAAPPAR